MNHAYSCTWTFPSFVIDISLPCKKVQKVRYTDQTEHDIEDVEEEIISRCQIPTSFLVIFSVQSIDGLMFCSAEEILSLVLFMCETDRHCCAVELWSVSFSKTKQLKTFKLNYFVEIVTFKKKYWFKINSLKEEEARTQIKRNTTPML